MSETRPLWITEADVVALMTLGQAIAALEEGLRLQARGVAKNMAKTHAVWGDGHTLHAIGATVESAGFVGTKTWAHTHGGATPLLIMWDADTGALMAIIEAFALGQMRTGAMSGVATHWMSAENADTMALFGTGKQALTQLAAVAAVRKLKTVRVYGRNAEKRDRFIEAVMTRGFTFNVEPAASVEDTARDAHIVTLVTRAREPFLTATHAARGAHINAIGAITPEREEFSQDVLKRADLVAADDPGTARKLSKEFRNFYGESDAGWEAVKPLSALIAENAKRPNDCDLSLFKAMGMGISDMALGIEIFRRAVAQGRGRPLEAPRKVPPRLHAD